MVFDGLCDREVPLQGEDDRHEDGGQDGDGLELVAEVGEGVGVPVAEGTHVLANACAEKREILNCQKNNLLIQSLINTDVAA